MTAAWVILLLPLAFVAGCSAPAPTVPMATVSVRVVQEALAGVAVAGANLTAVTKTCEPIDGFFETLDAVFGNDNCTRTKLEGTTAANGTWRAEYDARLGVIESVKVSADGFASRKIEPWDNATVILIRSILAQTGDLAAQPGAWVQHTGLGEAQEVLVPFAVHPDPAVNRLYLDHLQTFRVHIAWENTLDSHADLYAAAGRENRSIRSASVVTAEPCPPGPCTDEIEVDQREGLVAGPGDLLVGFISSSPVVAQQPVPVQLLVEYTFVWDADQS